MDNSDAIEQLKEKMPEIMAELYGVDVSKRHNFKCILGTHEDSNPSMSYLPSSRRIKCFACNISMDALDVLGITDPNGRGAFDMDKFIAACGKYGIEVDATPEAREEYRRRRTESEKVAAVIAEASKHINETGYMEARGISADTCQRFGIGYIRNYMHTPKSRPWGEALIIPTGPANYNARNLDRGASIRYKTGGEKHLFNAPALKHGGRVFVTEGEIDALSVEEAGGEAVALGGASCGNLLVEELRRIEPEQPLELLLALDNDEAGQKAQHDLISNLTAEGIKARRCNAQGQHKDANEALMEEREAFAHAVQNATDRPTAAEVEEYEGLSAKTALLAFYERVSESANTPATPTGFMRLDSALDGGLYEGLYMVGGLTSIGKTTLAMQIADNIAAGGRDVLIFSLEMSKHELIAKTLSRLTFRIALENGADKSAPRTLRGITDGRRYSEYTSEITTLINDAYNAYNTYAGHVFIREGLGDYDVTAIEQAATRHAYMRGCAPVILVDYLQIIAPAEDYRHSDVRQATDYSVLELKRLSRDLKTPVIAVSSLNRGNYSKAISFEAFKESGAIEYSSDVVIGLQFEGTGKFRGEGSEARNATWADKCRADDPRHIEAKILKYRNGVSGQSVYFDYYAPYNLFEERAMPFYKDGDFSGGAW